MPEMLADSEKPAPLSPEECRIFQRYARAAGTAGCPPDQIGNFVRARIVLQTRQLEASAAARLCDRSDRPTALGYGGARGGGKSFWLLAQMGADDCQRRPGLKCLLLRKVGKANLEHFEDLRRVVFSELKHEFNAHRGLLTFANGSRIVAGHFQCEKDIDAYLGLEYDVIGIEEATTLSHRKYIDISTCCRTSKNDFRPRIYSTSNPGGVGHAWYRAEFIEPYLRNKAATSNQCSVIGAELPITDHRLPITCPTLFIPARVHDNAFNNPEYAGQLARLSGWQRRAWYDGDWDIAAGQFFTNFRREIHVIDQFDPTLAREWFASLDYGYTHYTVVLLGCKDGDGNLYVIDEHAHRQWLPKQHAQALGAMLRRHARRPEDLVRFVAGADVFSSRYDGSSIAKQYRELGFTLTAANTDRVNGWAEILRRFGDPDGGIKPTLFIHSRCARLIETLPALQHDPQRPEDVAKWDTDEDGIGGDDFADALRYLVHTQPPKVEMGKIPW
jgi:hypothetical protein